MTLRLGQDGRRHRLYGRDAPRGNAHHLWSPLHAMILAGTVSPLRLNMPRLPGVGGRPSRYTHVDADCHLIRLDIAGEASPLHRDTHGSTAARKSRGVNPELQRGQSA